MDDAAKSSTDADEVRVVWFVDGLRVLVRGPDASHRAGRMRRRLLDLGANAPRNPNRNRVIIPRPRAGGFVVPVGLGAIPLAALRAVADALSAADATITYLELGFDVVGVPALDAAEMIVPLLVPARRQDRRRKVVSLSHRGAAYARRAKSGWNLAYYFDRPSKRAPDGPPVLHVEVRITGASALREERLRAPRDLARLADADKVACAFHRHVVLAEVMADDADSPSLRDVVERRHAGPCVVAPTASAIHAELGARAFDELLRPLGLDVDALASAVW